VGIFDQHGFKGHLAAAITDDSTKDDWMTMMIAASMLCCLFSTKRDEITTINHATDSAGSGPVIDAPSVVPVGVIFQYCLATTSAFVSTCTLTAMYDPDVQDAVVVPLAVRASLI